jgi:hypothetical protein
VNSTDDQLSLLSKTIAAHARESANREWLNEHKPHLLLMLERAGAGDLDEGMLTLHGKEIPIKAVVNALHDQFLAARTKALMQSIADQVVATAMRTITDEHK